MMKIIAVVVTFNRKDLLLQCLYALSMQTYKPQKVIIIDNASTDGTKTLLSEKDYIQENNQDALINGISFQYVHKDKNHGGAGGFYEGMRRAQQGGEYDGVWVMDDDGKPSINCLEKLVSYLGQYDYIAPLVLDCCNKDELAFSQGGKLQLAEIEERYKVDGIFPNFSAPFNGILFSKKVLAKVGLPKKEMFIWGDETNYDLRCKEEGFNPITVLSALFYHPKDRLALYDSCFHRKVVFVSQKWRGYCYYRNSIYNMHFRKHIIKKCRWLLCY